MGFFVCWLHQLSSSRASLSQPKLHAAVVSRRHPISCGRTHQKQASPKAQPGRNTKLPPHPLKGNVKVWTWYKSHVAIQLQLQLFFLPQKPGRKNCFPSVIILHMFFTLIQTNVHQVAVQDIVPSMVPWRPNGIFNHCHRISTGKSHRSSLKFYLYIRSNKLWTWAKTGRPSSSLYNQQWWIHSERLTSMAGPPQACEWSAPSHQTFPYRSERLALVSASMDVPQTQPPLGRKACIRQGLMSNTLSQCSRPPILLYLRL